jgi:hypothetical protein
MVAVLSEPLAARPNRFYVGFAIACVSIAVLGFAPTFWAPLASGRLQLAPLVWAHAALFNAWIAFFLSQAMLAASGRLGHHRALGMLGVMLAGAMLVVGWVAAIDSYHVQSAAGHAARAGPFLIAGLTNMIFFAGAVAIAAANVRRPDVHKRLMVLATIAVLAPAFGRMVQFILGAGPIAPPPIQATIVPALLTDLLLAAAVVHDWRTRGRPHPVYLIGGATLPAVQVGRIPLALTPGWASVVEWLTG